MSWMKKDCAFDPADWTPVVGTRVLSSKEKRNTFLLLVTRTWSPGSLDDGRVSRSVIGVGKLTWRGGSKVLGSD